MFKKILKIFLKKKIMKDNQINEADFQFMYNQIYAALKEVVPSLPRTIENPHVVGCKCGNTQMTDKIWDDDLGMWYTFWECPQCGYYWEGPLY